MTLSGQQVFVTGATGFIGGALALKLASDGVKVRALARSPARTKYLRDKANIEIVEGDILDADTMREYAQGCSVVFHVAAALRGPLSEQQPANIVGTRNVMQAAAQAKVGRMVYVSSIAAYGYTYDGDITEDLPPRLGRDPYSITKAGAEQVVREVSEQTGLSYSIIRPAFVYGPRSGLWTGTLFSIARRKPVLLPGGGKGSAHPIHLEDVIDLMTVLATHPAAHAQAFNCAPDPAPTWREFMLGYARLAGHQRSFALPAILAYALAGLAEPGLRFLGTPRDLPGMARYIQRRITYKMTKAQDLLGWQPKVDLQTGIESCAPWLRERGLLR